MSAEITAGTVVYAKDLARVSAFYAAVTGLALAVSPPGNVVLESSTFQLVIVAIPDHIAASIEIAEPAERREDSAVKPVFVVASIVDVRAVVAALGGELDPADRQWQLQQWLVCDGHDPEGNVIQLRQLAL